MIGKKLQKEIVWSTLVQLLGKGVQIGLGLLSIRLLTHALGSENYGLYGKISEFCLFFSTVGNLGIFGNMVRKMAETPRDSNLFWNALLLRLSTALFFFGAGLLYALLRIPNPMFFWGTLIFMASLLLDYLTSVCDGALQANYQMGRATLALLAGRAVNLGIIALLFYAGHTLTATYLFAPLLGSLITAGLSLGFVGKHMKLTGNWSSHLQKDLLWASLPFGIINLLNSVYYRFLPSALLADSLSNRQFGTYNLSLHLTATLSLFSTFLMFSILPGFRHALKEGHPHTVKDLYKQAHRGLTVLTLLVIAGGSLLGPYFLTLVSSQDFLAPDLWFILPLMLLLTGFSYFYDLTFLTLFGLGKERWWLKREFAGLAIGLSIGALSLLEPDPTPKFLLILSSALLAEGAMALMGLLKCKKELARL